MPATAAALVASRTDYPAMSQPTSVAVADLFGTGHADLVVANPGSNTVSVFPGTGTGYGVRQDYPVGNGPSAVAIADLDRDGRLDLVVCSSRAATVSILPGLAGGGFGTATDLALPTVASAVVVGDWNGDGVPDLALALPTNNAVAVLLGRTGGGFGPVASYSAQGAFPNALAVADVDSDGVPDLVVACTGSNAVSVLTGDGAGGFAGSGRFATGIGPVALAAADLNGDGRPDVVVANSAASSLSVLLADGAGGFLPHVDYAVTGAPAALAVGDLDLDGAADVALACPGNATAAILTGDGAGGFLGSTQTLGTAASPAGIAIARQPGSPYPALAVPASGANVVSVFALTAGSSITLASSANPTAHSRPDTLTARVAPAAATGTVTFYDGGRVLSAPPVPLAGGVATWIDTTLVPGAHALTAAYSGDGQHNASVSAPLAQDVLPGLTSLQFTVTPNPAAYGQAVTLDARISPSTAAGVVRFYDGADVVEVEPLNVGLASFQFVSPTGGSHSLTAVYGGSNTDNPCSAGPVVLVVQNGPLATATTLTASPNPAVVGQIVTFSGTVTPAPATGTVQVFDNYGATLVATATVVNGAYSAGTASLALGVHVLIAKFGGSGSLQASWSPDFIETVGHLRQAPVTLTLASAPNPSHYGQLTTLTGTVTPSTATGLVTFWQGSTALGAAALGGGAALLSLSSLAVGSDTLYATYPGDAVDTSGTSPPHVHVVAAALSATALTSSLDPSIETQSVGFQAMVGLAGAGSAPVTGQVQFAVDGASFGPPVTLASGSATSQQTSALAPGDHLVQAHYLGTPTLQSSDSPVLTQHVRRAGPEVRSIADVPDDQGRFVRLAILPSPFDAAGSGKPIVRYSVFRAIESAPAAAARAAGPAGRTLDGWEQVAGFDAYLDTLYWAVAPTLVDSNAAGTHPATYFVRAGTANPAVYFDSPPLSGYSVDNLPPATPAPFAARYGPAATQLHWGPNGEPDFAVYRLYRGGTADFVPGAANLLVQKPDTGYVDASMAAAGAYYRLSAVDLNGNESPCAEVGPPGAPAPGGLALALEPPRANPSSDGMLWLAFTLPDAAPARLELLDVGGRCVRANDVGALGAGRHVVELLGGRAVSPGVYVVRLVQGTSSRSVRAVVLR